MTTLTIDLLKDEALNLLKDLEALKVIRIKKKTEDINPSIITLSAKYSGATTKQPKEEIDQQLSELRNEWN